MTQTYLLIGSQYAHRGNMRRAMLELATILSASGNDIPPVPSEVSKFHDTGFPKPQVEMIINASYAK